MLFLLSQIPPTSFKDWNITLELLLFLIPLIFFSGTFYSLVQELKKDLENVADDSRNFQERASFRLNSLEKSLFRQRFRNHSPDDYHQDPLFEDPDNSHETHT